MHTRAIVRYPGLNWRTKRLADGSVKTYYWAWKGGPSLPGKPGEPEFTAAFNAARIQKISPPRGELLSILIGYQASDDFLHLAAKTRKDYGRYITDIEKKFGDLPLSALTDRAMRGEFMAWRDKLAQHSRRGADYSWTVLARVLSWALDRGLVAANPCEKGGRLYRGSRADKTWTDEDESSFLASAPTHLHLALLLALWTGQRQGDLLRLPWSAYDGARIKLRQSKTGARVLIPVGAPLKAALDKAAANKASTIILTNTDGKPWTSDGFRSSWRKACAKAGIEGLTFHDLRGTAVTRLSVAGCTPQEVATLTGHSLRDVGAILDAHYLSRDPAMAESAIQKLEARSSKREPNLPTGLPTVPTCSNQKGGKA